MSTAIYWRRCGDTGAWHLYVTCDDADEAVKIVRDLRECGHEAKTATGETRPHKDTVPHA